jgi:hypothetical protein
MNAVGWLQIAFYLAVLTALTPLLGGYMARVYQGQPLLLERVFGPLERFIYRLLGPSARSEQDWKAYAKTTIVFSAVFFVVLYVILRTQGIHPWNPEGFDSGLGPLLQHHRLVKSPTRATGSTTAVRRPHLLLPRWRPRGPELRLGRRQDGRAEAVIAGSRAAAPRS